MDTLIVVKDFMMIESHASVPNILLRLADILGTTIKNNRLEIPSKFGSGYCAGYIFNEHIRMMISHYELKEDITVENSDMHPSRMLFFKFQHIFPAEEMGSAGIIVKGIPAVLIATSRLSTDEVISIHTNTSTINIEVDANYLRGIFNLPDKSSVLQSLLDNTQPLLFEQILYPSLQKIVNEIMTESVDEMFKLFFVRVKAEELICRLLIELEKRDATKLYTLNTLDIAAIYQAKARMLEQLATPPLISELAVVAGMSATKLKQLFKQVFGNSIFSYYQEFRMKEAARLLKEEKLSVSEAGYQLGFTNLSHFTKVFEAHMGIKPKQYSRSNL